MRNDRIAYIASRLEVEEFSKRLQTAVMSSTERDWIITLHTFVASGTADELSTN